AMLNLDHMEPSIVFLERETGALIEKHELPSQLSRLSTRHMDIDAAGRVWIGCQYQGEIADNPPLVVHGIKQVLDRARSAAVDDSLRFVAAWNAAFLPSNDLSEAITAIFEKRKPNFIGD
ncbi:MAG TPA: DUF1513 domain-containing protein, partial [Gordonia sp. (in: high G+C Gram-positive bacteria)]|nr:DUF1513 domain-containing protein [Gordonia sp. (in: high G+C Gram-positive bacteria)]